MGIMGPDRAARQTRDVEWPHIRANIDAGRLAMVGLVRQQGWSPWQLAQSHQVLAYAYEVDGDAVTLRVYDPNWPGQDDVALSFDPTGVRQSTGEQLAGFLDLG
jgi:hypothetical protein